MLSARHFLITLSVATLLTTQISAQQPLPEATVPIIPLHVFAIHRPLVLFCNVTSVDTNAKLTWTRDGRNVNQIPELQHRYEVIDAEHKFVIERTVEEDAGQYACTLPGAANMLPVAQFRVIANVAARLARNTQLIEGESLWLVCRVAGTEPTVAWILPDNRTLTNSTDRIILEHENNVPNSALYIAQVVSEDRGEYTCRAENLATANGHNPGFASGMVRIREKLAPLYPVAGILVELFVLFVVLYTYEKFFHIKDDIEDDNDDYMETPTKPASPASPAHSGQYNKKEY